MDTFIIWASGEYPNWIDEEQFGACSTFRIDCCRLEKGDKIHLALTYECSGVRNKLGELGRVTVKNVIYTIGFKPDEQKAEIQQLVYVKSFSAKRDKGV